MSRIFIMSDMEGVAGITKWDQCTGGHAMYGEGRKLYTEEINAAVRGAFDGGATEVVVMDCHGAGKGWTFNSLIHEDLDPRCDYVVQRHWTEYTEFLEQGCDAALFVAMHAMAGTPNGVLCHTVSGTQMAHPSLQRGRGRRDRHQRRAVRQLGRPGVARNRRCTDVRRSALSSR